MDDIYTKLWSEWRRREIDPAYRISRKKTWLYKCIDWYEMKKYILPHERIVVLDSRTKQWVADFFERDAAIVHNGLAKSDFVFFDHKPPAKNRVKLFSSGIFFPHRRYEDIIEAVQMLRNAGIGAVLTISGSYSGQHRAYYASLEKLIRKHHLESFVSFLGTVSDEELRRQFKDNDIYISANHLQSWGITPFEAMASGMPAIISKTTGAAEVLSDRKNALLVSAKSPEAIAGAVRELLQSPDLYTHLSREGRILVENEITWQNTANQLTNIFEKLWHSTK